MNILKLSLVCTLLHSSIKTEIALLPHADFQAIIDFVAPLLPPNPLIIEAGAHHGRNTLDMHNQWPQSIIHAFEPVPQSYALLKKITLQFTNIFCHQIALSNVNGYAPFYLSDNHFFHLNASAHSSLLQVHNGYRHLLGGRQTIGVKTITLDSWARENMVNQIDFMWLNVQGYALPILKASPHILKNIRIIAVEVEFKELYQGQSLFYEIKQWMLSNGFEIIAVNFDTTERYWFGDIVFQKKDIISECLDL